LELADQILKFNPDENILLCSGYTGKKLRWSTIEEKGFDFLPKPFSLRELLCKVKAAIEPSIT
ncbi:MAG: hybrid sensor histidine kinase/response regulator, partial [bacterium]